MYRSYQWFPTEKKKKLLDKEAFLDFPVFLHEPTILYGLPSEHYVSQHLSYTSIQLPGRLHLKKRCVIESVEYSISKPK